MDRRPIKDELELLDPVEHEIDGAIQDQEQDTYSPALADYPQPDNGLALMISRRADAEQIDGDLKFLESLGNPGGDAPVAEPVPPKPKQTTPRQPGAPPEGNRTDRAAMAAVGASLENKPATALDELESLATDRADPGVLKTVLDNSSAVIADIAEGLTEAPEQIVGGISDAVSAMVGVGDMLQELAPLPGFRIWDLEGNFDPAFASAEEVTADMRKRKKTNQPFLPSISPKADTVTGSMFNGMAQFLAGFADPQSFKAQVEFIGPVIGVWPGQSAGECLGSILPNGTLFGATGGADLEPGCLVALADSAGVFQGKIFLGRKETVSGAVYLAAQINPPMVRFYAENEIVAMHRIWFWIDEKNEPREVSVKAAEAFDDLFKPLYGSKCGAINPDWRPPECVETPKTPERIH